MKIALTGASGFVGRHVVPLLAARDVEIIVGTRGSSGFDSFGPQVTVVPLEIASPEGAFGRLGKPDVLLHLAWGGLPHYQSPAHVDFELPKQIAFLNACVRDGLRRLVVTGTCLEYGMRPGCLDETLPTAPVAAYGRAKDLLRSHLQKLVDTSGLQLTWLRLFYLYGPGQAPSSLYSQLRAAIASGATEFPMSPGDQLRDFLPIETVAEKLVALTLNPRGLGIVNLCSGMPVTISALVRKWLDEWGAELQLKPGVYPYPNYEPREFWGSAQRLETLLEESSILATSTVKSELGQKQIR